MTPADEINAAARVLRSATFRGAMTATPAVAALLRARGPIATLLESAAKHHDDGFLCCDQGPHACSEVVAPALAVARAINGQETPWRREGGFDQHDDYRTDQP